MSEWLERSLFATSAVSKVLFLSLRFPSTFSSYFNDRGGAV